MIGTVRKSSLTFDPKFSCECRQSFCPDCRTLASAEVLKSFASASQFYFSSARKRRVSELEPGHNRTGVELDTRPRFKVSFVPSDGVPIRTTITDCRSLSHQSN